MRLVLAVLAILLPAMSAAQFPPALIDRPPAEFVPAAFDAPYGRLLVAAGAKIVRENADPACLSARGIDPASLEERVRALYVKNGLRFFEIAGSFIDTAKFEAAFVQYGGPNAIDDQQRLRSDPDVATINDMNRRISAVKVADQVVEAIDRHLLLKRILTKARLSPLATGNTELLTVGEKESDENAIDRYIKSHPTPAVQRWLTLQEAFGRAAQAASDRDRMLRFGPVQYTPEAAEDFAGLCIIGK